MKTYKKEKRLNWRQMLSVSEEKFSELSSFFSTLFIYGNTLFSYSNECKMLIFAYSVSFNDSFNYYM